MKKSEDNTAADDKGTDLKEVAVSDASDASNAPSNLLALVANLTAAQDVGGLPHQIEKKSALPEPAVSGVPVLGAVKKDSASNAVDPSKLASKILDSAPIVKDGTLTPVAFSTSVHNAKESSAGTAPSEALADLSKSGKTKDGLAELTTTKGQKDLTPPDVALTQKYQDVQTNLIPIAKGKDAIAELSSSPPIKELLPATSGPVTAPVQQASLTLAQLVNAPPMERLSPPVGSPGWDQALGQKVVWMVAGGLQSASMTLNPPDLGPLQVVVSVTNDQANATFTAAQPEVRQALEAAMPRLREMMSEAGIQLGSATVSTGLPNQQNGTQEQTRSPASRFEQASPPLESPLHPMGKAAVKNGLGLVDTFA